MDLTEEELDIILTYLENGTLPTFDLYGKTIPERLDHSLKTRKLIQKLKRLKDAITT